MTPEPEVVTLARAVLEAHYKEPVYPVSQVCEAVYTWAECIRENHKDGPQEDRQGVAYHGVLSMIRLDTMKSSLLGRLLYGREKLRTQPCPIHKGRWSGLGAQFDACGCDGTGWLREHSAP